MRKLLLPLLLCSAVASTSAASDAGSTGAAFLRIPVSARAVALGTAFTAVSGDATAIEFNPASLAGINRTDINAVYLDHLQDTSLQALSIGFPFVFRQSRPLDALEVNSFSQDRLYFGVQYRVFRADDIERNAVGVRRSEFDIRDQMAEVAVAYPLHPRLSVGVAGKVISQKIQNIDVNTFAGDIGTLYQFSPRFTGGAAIVNIGPSKAFVTEKDPLPLLVKAGAGYRWGALLLLADAAQGRDGVTRVAGGAEFTLNRWIQVRGGALENTGLQLSGGLGIRFAGPQKAPQMSRTRQDRKSLGDLASTPAQSSGFKSNIDIGLDYGIASHNDLGITHTVSLRILY